MHRPSPSVSLVDPQVDPNSSVKTYEAVNNHAPKRGRPAQYEWDNFWAELVAYVFKNDPPERPADLEKHMSDWCGRTWGRIPASSVLREKISLVYQNPMLRSHRRA